MSILVPLSCLTACSPSFTVIDERVNELLIERTVEVDGQVPPRPVDEWAQYNATDAEMNTKQPPTVNPPAADMSWTSLKSVESDEVLKRMKSYQHAADDGEELTLEKSLRWAFEHGREYCFAEEDYVLSCLRLLLELHLWTPQITDDIELQYQHTDGDNDFLESATAVVNTLGASQRLPWGGQITASYVATFSHEVLGAASTSTPGDTTTSRVGQFRIGGSIPLLRGAGMIAQEDLIQAERNLVYAARAFEDFRRDFWFTVVSDWFGLLVQRQELDNAIEAAALLDKLSQRRRALYEAGRARLYDAAEAENRALQETSRVAGLWESYRLAVDRFKLLINWPVDQPVRIAHRTIAIHPPVTDLDHAVDLALHQRLDLQTERDRLIDRQRVLRNAFNGLLPDLNLSGNIRFGANDTYYYDTVLPSLEDLDAEAALVLGLPIDREAERLAVRRAQIDLERGRRRYNLSRDDTAIEVRAAVRDIDANMFSLDIQRRNVEIARLNIESIDADPDSYTVLDQLSAIQSLQQAQNGRARAFRRVQESIMQYLIRTGQMRIGPDAEIDPIPGMLITETDSLSWEETSSISSAKPIE